jgi:hypothetical protein
MDTCQFTYVAKKDDLKKTAVGVEQSWDVLCVKLNREGPGLSGGTHYFTISVEGPELFAVDASGSNVYYHHEGQWHRYITACDIKFDTIDDAGMGCPPRAVATAKNSQ